MSKDLVRHKQDEADSLMRLFGSEMETDPQQTVAVFEWQGALFVGKLRFMFPQKPYIAVVTKQLEQVPLAVVNTLQKEKKGDTFLNACRLAASSLASRVYRVSSSASETLSIGRKKSQRPDPPVLLLSFSG